MVKHSIGDLYHIDERPNGMVGVFMVLLSLGVDFDMGFDEFLWVSDLGAKIRRTYAYPTERIVPSSSPGRSAT